MTFEWHGSGHGLLGVWFGYQSTWRSHLGVVLQSFDLRAFLEDCTCTTRHFVNASSLVKYLHGRNAEINGPHHNFCVRQCFQFCLCKSIIIDCYTSYSGHIWFSPLIFSFVYLLLSIFFSAEIGVEIPQILFIERRNLKGWLRF